MNLVCFVYFVCFVDLVGLVKLGGLIGLIRFGAVRQIFPIARAAGGDGN
jgi:hypothetical protein